MPRISDIARQRLMHMILEDIGSGLVDHQIMDKRGINARTFYRYKKLIGKQCQKILDKQSEEDISLAIFQLEQRYTKYLQNIEKKLLDDTAADATATTINRKPELLYEMAAELAKKIFNLKCKGSTLVMRWRKDRQDIEIITGYYIPPSSSRRIQIPEYKEDEIEPEPRPEPEDMSREKMMEFDKAKIDAYKREAMRK
jgi:hypothetical protein